MNWQDPVDFEAGNHGLAIADTAKGLFDGRHHIGHTDIETLGIGVGKVEHD